MALVDPYGRKIDYLRISITDFCNLSCSYCSPPFSGHPRLDRSEILTYEELARLAEAAVAAGISKIRITGGEPLMRRGVIEFCRMLSGIQGLTDLAMTTNGIRLVELAEDLYRAGVRRINVSLDTLKRDRFRKITGKDALGMVLEGIVRAEAIGFDPIKINTVVMRGVNSDEVADLARLTFEKPFQVRFIELMPFRSGGNSQYAKLYMPIREIMERIPGIDRACIDLSGNQNGPARLCRLPGAAGKIGFIAPLSWHFCGSCNRLRLTADGKIRTCLFSRDEIDVKTPLRRGADRRELITMISNAVANKPRRNEMDRQSRKPPHDRGMYAIGG